MLLWDVAPNIHWLVLTAALSQPSAHHPLPALSSVKAFSAHALKGSLPSAMPGASLLGPPSCSSDAAPSGHPFTPPPPQLPDLHLLPSAP